MAESLESTLSVFLGRGLLSQGIRQTIEDFTAAGLLSDLVWVDADVFENSSSLVTELHVDADGTPHVTRRPFNELVSRSGARRMNLGIVNVIDDAQSTLGYAELAPLIRTIDSVCVNFEIHRTNVMITSVNAPLAGELPILNGYINLMLAPEDSPGPDTSTVAYRYEDLDHTFVLHCTAGIASLFGLWEGSISAPVTALEPAKGGSFRLVRAFYRHIDGQAVQSRLKDLILDTEKNPLPKLKDPGGRELSAQYTENSEVFAEKAAAELFEEFGDTLELKKEDSRVRNTRVISSGQALKEFLGQWWRNMLKTPSRAFKDYRLEFTSMTDDAIQAGIYGTTDTAVRVGNYSGELGRNSLERNRRTSQMDIDLKTAVDLGKMWRSYGNMAKSLVDAEARAIGNGENPVRRPQAVNSGASDRVSVARSAEEVVPGPTAHYGANLPVEIKVRVDGGEVAPYDVMGVEEFEQRLANHSDSGQRGIGTVIGEFKQWQSQNSKSYAYFVGEGLRNRMHQQKVEEQRLNNKIAELKGNPAKNLKLGAAPSVFRWLGYVTFWSGVLFAGLWGFINYRHEPATELVPWVLNLNNADSSTKWWFFGVWFLIWLICWIAQIATYTQQTIRVKEYRTIKDAELKTAEANLEITKQTLHRLNVAYQQFLSTSKIIGVLLEQPFGRISRSQEDPLILKNSVPDSVVFAEATPDSLAVEQLARRFRREVFAQGWLDRHVRDGLTRAASILSEESGHNVNIDRVFSTTGHNTYGDLARLAEIIESEEFRSADRSVDTWDAITYELAHDPVTYRSGVLDNLMVYRDGVQTPAPQRSSLERNVTTGSFNGEISTEIGRVHGILELDPALCTYEPHTNTADAIGVSEVLLQVSGPVNKQDIAFDEGPQQHSSQVLIEQMPVDENFDSSTSATTPRFSIKNDKNLDLPGMGEF